MWSPQYKKVDAHFLSASHSCDVCHIKYDLIGKMETFIDDVKYILAYVNRSDVFDSMGDVDSNNEQRIIGDITARTFRTFPLLGRSCSGCLGFRTCYFKEFILKRLWMLWQIRGFVSDNQNFPWKNATVVCKVTQVGFVQNSLTAIELSEDRASRKAQRHKYLLQAFKSVPLAVLKRYRKAVQRDCDLFGYDCSPDYIFGGRTDGDEESNVFSHITVNDTESQI